MLSPCAAKLVMYSLIIVRVLHVKSNASLFLCHAVMVVMMSHMNFSFANLLSSSFRWCDVTERVLRSFRTQTIVGVGLIWGD
ncbi:hypothetical protein F4604DRAFT_1728590 [Suillus subluteus]|nr:hypothetical protein F4604DRAFT_1728590 [Suillus subluteus]